MSKKMNQPVKVKEVSSMEKPIVYGQKGAKVRQHFSSMCERLAQSTVCYRNYKFRNAETYFPNEAKMWTVDMYFPYATGGGELLFDEANHESDHALFERKKPILAKLGYRYIVIDKTSKESDLILAVEGIQ